MVVPISSMSAGRWYVRIGKHLQTTDSTIDNVTLVALPKLL